MSDNIEIPSESSEKPNPRKSSASPKKSVKPRVLPSKRLTSKFSAQSSLKARSGAASASRPLGPRAVRPGTNTSRITTGRTPEKAQGNSKKACSTPTSDETSLPDNTLDFSVIPGSAGGNKLEETVNVAPVMRIGPGSRSRANARPSARLPPRMTPSSRKGDSWSSVRPAAKQVDIVEEADEEDEITDEMLEGAYTRYIQACYIRKKTLEAKEKAREDARRQILSAFFATEELRLEVQRREQAAQRKEAIKMLNKSLEVLETKLPHLMKMLLPVNEKLSNVASNLDQVKHNLVVQGMNISDKEAGLKQLEKISNFLETFLEEVSLYNEVARAEEESLGKMARYTTLMKADYRDIVEFVRECKKKIKQNEDLVVRQASLALSLSQLKKSKEELSSE